MTASNELIFLLVWPLPETAMGLLGNCLVGALPCEHNVIRLFSLCGVLVKVLPRTYNLTRPPVTAIAKKKEEKKKYASVVADRRQANL